jgi:HD-GYP domain-containing protein (c-di-GMP phosphodiesterase class II)
VGKIGIRETVLNKNGPLTEDEFAHVRITCGSASKFVAAAAPRRVAVIYSGCHEHWDGSGYPRQLASTDITLGSRILTAADAFDALTSKRAYRDPLTANTTLEYLRTQAGRLLEPQIYEALGAVVRRGHVPELPRIS